jgi:hypothetical protein
MHIGASTDSRRSAAPQKASTQLGPRGSAPGARPFRPPGAGAPSAAGALAGLRLPLSISLRSIPRRETPGVSTTLRRLLRTA